MRLIGQLHSGFYNGLSVLVTYMNAIDDVEMGGGHGGLTVEYMDRLQLSTHSLYTTCSLGLKHA